MIGKKTHFNGKEGLGFAHKNCFCTSQQCALVYQRSGDSEVCCHSGTRRVLCWVLFATVAQRLRHSGGVAIPPQISG